MQYVSRWNYRVSESPVSPGIWSVESGGFVVRAHGKFRAMTSATLKDAMQVRDSLATPAASTMRFDVYARQVMMDKTTSGDLGSPATIDRWHSTLEQHILPVLGSVRCAEMRCAHVDAWRNGLANSPRSKNMYISVLQTITKRMSRAFEIEDPCRGIEMFRAGRTYTFEEPNSLTPEETAAFLTAIGQQYPHLALFTLLMFITGQRPSHLRPIRTREDVLWTENAILIRRSNARRRIIVERTKTDAEQRIALPARVMEMLSMQAGKTYLFEHNSTMLSTSALAGPFSATASSIGLDKHITPRAGRRTFQDIARVTSMADVVTKSISGHATDRMRVHYSTAYAMEQQAGISRILEAVTT